MDSHHAIQFHSHHSPESSIRLDAVAHAHVLWQLHVLPADLVEVAFDCAADRRVADGRRVTLRAVLPFHQKFTLGVARCSLELRVAQAECDQNDCEQM